MLIDLRIRPLERAAHDGNRTDTGEGGTCYSRGERIQQEPHTGTAAELQQSPEEATQ